MKVERGEASKRIVSAISLGLAVRPNGIVNCQFTRDNRGLVFATGLFEDTYGLGYLALDDPSRPRPGTVGQRGETRSARTGSRSANRN